jgi:tubulin polyglutamylase TTLL1/tubulin monoglycylase TTLL3/8
MKKTLINWITDKQKTLLTSLVASHNTLSDYLGNELSSGDVEAEVLQGHSCRTEANMQSKSRTDLSKLKRREKDETARYTRRLAASRTRNPLPIEYFPFKSALRDHSWVSKARLHLSQALSLALRLSNGVSLAIPSETHFCYYLGRGNNHNLVKNCFKSRGNWMEVDEDTELEEANLVWTQGKAKYLFRCYPESELIEIGTKQCGQIGISCPVLVTSKDQNGIMKSRSVDISPLNFDLITLSPSYTHLPCTLTFPPSSLHTHNKLEHNYHLTNKKTLFLSLRKYCEVTNEPLIDLIPLTYHISNGLADIELMRFMDLQTAVSDSGERKLKGVWIVKPGENTNRGTGIAVCGTIEQVKAEISAHSLCPISGLKRTFILQKYIENPLLINRRKFDIRCFTLITAVNSVIQCYFYQEGYLRTSSKEFSLKDYSNRFIHLTNDAVQKYSEDYGKYESGNKLSYSDLQRYMDGHNMGKTVQRDVIGQIRRVIKTSVLATFAKLNADNTQYSFEILGYDFMMDASCKVWLIEVNTNPCLEMSSPLLARIIPAMLDNAFRIAVDPYFPDSAPSVSSGSKRLGASLTGELIPENRFELVFHSQVEGLALRTQLGSRFHLLEEFDRSLQDMPDESFYESSSEG